MADRVASPPVSALVKLSGLGALVGIPVGLAAFAFMALVHGLEHWLWHSLPEALGLDGPPWYLLIGLPTLGGVLVYLARRLPGDGGPSPLHLGLPPPAKPVNAWSVGLAGLATLPFGMVLGPEAPLLAVGAALAVSLTQAAKLDATGNALVGYSGAAAALSTLFGGPLVAGLLVLEGGASAGVAIIPIMLPCLMAASVSFFLITGLGNWTGLPVHGLAVSDLPPYEAVLFPDVLVALVGGVVMGVLGISLQRLAHRVATLEDRIGRLPLLAGAGATVGLLAWSAGLLGAAPLDVLFSGQNGITSLLQSPAQAAIVLAGAKMLAYVVSLGGGFRGGAIFPAIFFGVAVAYLAVLFLGLSPTVAVAIGAGAGMAALTRMLMSALVFTALLVGTAGVEALPVGAIAAVAAWLAASALESRFPVPEAH